MIGFGLTKAERSRDLSRILALLLGVTLVGCGGGGGGSDDSDGPASGVMVFHGSIDTAPLVLKDEAATTESRAAVFGSASPFVREGNGDRSFIVSVRGRPERVVGRVAIRRSGDDKHAILVYRDPATGGTAAAARKMQDIELNGAESGLRLGHVAYGAAAITAEVVPVSGSAVQFAGVGYPSLSDPIPVPSGEMRIVVRRQVDGFIIADTTVALEAGNHYTFYVAGEVEYFVTRNLVRG